MQALYHVEVQASALGWSSERLRLAGDLWREAGDLDRALAYWQAAAIHGGDDPALFRSLADAALELQRWPVARDALSRLVMLDPNNRRARFEIGLLLASLRSHDAAAHLQAAALDAAYTTLSHQLIAALDDVDSASALAVGAVLAEHSLWQYAELAFVQVAALTIAPEAFACVGWARAQQGKNGAVWIERALALEPANPRVRALHGLYLRQIGDYLASVDALAMAAALDPSNPTWYAELGAAHYLLGDLSTASYWLERAAAISDGDPRFVDLLDALAGAEDALLQSLGLELLTLPALTTRDEPADPSHPLR
ncbi:MAG: tetratricopeptide repeat protein [Aggregatilineales bacterium]